MEREGVAGGVVVLFTLQIFSQLSFILHVMTLSHDCFVVHWFVCF